VGRAEKRCDAGIDHAVDFQLEGSSPCLRSLIGIGRRQAGVIRILLMAKRRMATDPEMGALLGSVEQSIETLGAPDNNGIATMGYVSSLTEFQRHP
jgi:hypothetical protein